MSDNRDYLDFLRAKVGRYAGSSALKLVMHPLGSWNDVIAWRRRKAGKKPRMHMLLQRASYRKKGLYFPMPGWNHKKLIGCQHRLTVVSTDCPFELDALDRKAANQLSNVSRQEFDLWQHNRCVDAPAIERESDRGVVMIRLLRSQRRYLVPTAIQNSARSS